MKPKPKTLKGVRHLRRRRHIRKTVAGTAGRPRISVRRSLKNLFCQVIDDDKGVTLVGLGTSSKDVRDEVGGKGGNVAAAEALGKKVAEKAKAAGVTEVIFDRGGFRYHGRVKALADGAREGGLQF